MDDVNFTPINSEEVTEIITNVPSWIIRSGISIISGLLCLFVFFSGIFSYPDLIRTELRIKSINSPKTVISRQNVKLTRLIVQNGQSVKENEVLAYLESVAEPRDVFKLLACLEKMKTQLKQNQDMLDNIPTNLKIGELSKAYQIFSQELFDYQSTQNNGFYSSQLKYLDKNLSNIKMLKQQIIKKSKIQDQEYKNVEEEYVAHKKLFEKGIISRSEFKQQENKYLASKYPIEQATSDLLVSDAGLIEKNKAISDLKHEIIKEKSLFYQALQTMINEINNWRLEHALTSPVDGVVEYSGVLQEGQNLIMNQEVFVINTGNTSFFGEVEIPQLNMAKVKKDEKVLVKLKSYPFEQYGIIKGKLSYISSVALRDSVFIGRVEFEHFENKEKIVLKNGMTATAEIITEQSSLLKRFYRQFLKIKS